MLARIQRDPSVACPARAEGPVGARIATIAEWPESPAFSKHGIVNS